MRRRRFLELTVGSTALMAGCISNNGDDNDLPDNPFQGHLDEVPGYEGPTDLREEDEVTVMVGTEVESGYHGFDPMGIVITEGTTVTWEWTGNGDAHNVVSRNQQVIIPGPDMYTTESEEGFTGDHTFNSTGTTRYLCVEHEPQNMKGAVRVVRDPTE